MKARHSVRDGEIVHRHDVPVFPTDVVAATLLARREKRVPEHFRMRLVCLSRDVWHSKATQFLFGISCQLSDRKIRHDNVGNIIHRQSRDWKRSDRTT